MTFRLGDRVLQRVYGAGAVVAVNADHITISFDTGGIRKFSMRLVHLERTNLPRPPRPDTVARPRKRRSTMSTV